MFIDIEAQLEQNSFHTRYEVDKYKTESVQVQAVLREKCFDELPDVDVQISENPLPKGCKEFFQCRSWYVERAHSKAGTKTCPEPQKLFRYPRLGAFEVTVRCPQGFAEPSAGLPTEFVAWSKIKTHMWPNLTQLAGEIANVLNLAREGRDVGHYFQDDDGIPRLRFRSNRGAESDGSDVVFRELTAHSKVRSAKMLFPPNLPMLIGQAPPHKRGAHQHRTAPIVVFPGSLKERQRPLSAAEPRSFSASGRAGAGGAGSEVTAEPPQRLVRPASATRVRPASASGLRPAEGAGDRNAAAATAPSVSASTTGQAPAVAAAPPSLPRSASPVRQAPAAAPPPAVARSASPARIEPSPTPQNASALTASFTVPSASAKVPSPVSGGGRDHDDEHGDFEDDAPTETHNAVVTPAALAVMHGRDRDGDVEASKPKSEAAKSVEPSPKSAGSPAKAEPSVPDDDGDDGYDDNFEESASAPPSPSRKSIREEDEGSDGIFEDNAASKSKSASSGRVIVEEDDGSGDDFDEASPKSRSEAKAPTSAPPSRRMIVLESKDSDEEDGYGDDFEGSTANSPAKVAGPHAPLIADDDGESEDDRPPPRGQATTKAAPAARGRDSDEDGYGDDFEDSGGE